MTRAVPWSAHPTSRRGRTPPGRARPRPDDRGRVPDGGGGQVRDEPSARRGARAPRPGLPRCRRPGRERSDTAGGRNGRARRATLRSPLAEERRPRRAGARPRKRARSELRKHSTRRCAGPRRTLPRAHAHRSPPTRAAGPAARRTGTTTRTPACAAMRRMRSPSTTTPSPPLPTMARTTESSFEPDRPETAMDLRGVTSAMASSGSGRGLGRRQSITARTESTYITHEGP